MTGGGGFLGLAIVRRLLDRGDRVVTFSRSESAVLRAWGVEQRQGDLAEAEAVASAAQGCETVFHAAAKAGVWGAYEEYYRANVEGTRHVVEACRRHKIPRLVYTSSPSVVFDGRDMEGVDESAPYPKHFEAHYPRTKALAEQSARAANSPTLATVCLRPHLIWGPGDNHLLPRLAARARSGQLRRIGSGAQRVDAVYVDNAAQAHLQAADRLWPGSALGGRVYFLAQGEPVGTWDLIGRLLEAAGAPPVRGSVPEGLALALAWGFETLHRITRNPREPRLTRFVVKELARSHWFDLTAARRDLGYAPAVSTEEGLSRVRAAWQSGREGRGPAGGQL